MQASGIELTSLPYLKPTDEIGFARELMLDNQVFNLPVIDTAGTLHGLLTFSSIRKLKSSILVQSNSEILQQFYVSSDDSINQIFRKFNQSSISVLPVISEEGIYLGCITADNLVKYCSTMAAVDVPGATLQLEIGLNDFVLSEIARIAESCNALIISCFVSSPSNALNIQVNLKFNKLDLTPIIASLERFDYKILAYWHEPLNEDFYDRRFKEFLNYLNI